MHDCKCNASCRSGHLSSCVYTTTRHLYTAEGDTGRLRHIMCGSRAHACSRYIYMAALDRRTTCTGHCYDVFALVDAVVMSLHASVTHVLRDKRRSGASDGQLAKDAHVHGRHQALADRAGHCCAMVPVSLPFFCGCTRSASVVASVITAGETGMSWLTQ